MNEDLEILRIYGNGEIPTEYMSVVLNRIHVAYEGLLFLDFIADLTSSQIKSKHYNFTPTEFGITEKTPLLSLHKLVTKSVFLQSPGWWEFLGKINPLETIRQYLNDRHERRKDESYRNQIEKNVLTLELVEKVICVAKQAGMSDSEIASMVRDHAIIPLCRLESLQDSRIISHAELPRKKQHVHEEDPNV